MPVTFFPSPSSGGGTDPLSLLASQPEAEAGSVNDKLMSPVRTAQAIAALGGGGGVPTGAMMHFVGEDVPSGWLRCNGAYIGNAGSGAQYESTDLHDLFVLLWEEDSTLSILPIRGASAQHDWEILRPIQLPNATGRVLVAKDGAEFSILGEHIGENTHQLTPDELPVVGDHTHITNLNSTTMVDPGMSTTVPVSGLSEPTQPGGGFGADSPHNNIQPSLVVGCVIIKI